MTHKAKKIFKQVPRILFGYGTLERLNELLPNRSNDNSHLLFLIDNIHHETGLMDRIELGDADKIFWVDTSYEPTKTNTQPSI